jgi:hypothetical protein
MHVLERNIYGDSMLRDIIVLHFENHPLATRPLYIDANARTHKTRSVTEYKLPEYTKLYCFYMPDWKGNFFLYLYLFYVYRFPAENKLIIGQFKSQLILVH